jgi:predicted ATPase
MDRITRLHIKRLPAIESLELGRPLTVLIGENGPGKSTVLEGLELLRSVVERNFMHRFHTVHRGMPGMVRAGATSLELGVTIEDDACAKSTLAYDFAIASNGSQVVIAREGLASGRPDSTESRRRSCCASAVGPACSMRSTPCRRWSARFLFPAERLELGGRNLANAWAELNSRSTEELDRVLDLVRVGLGEQVDRVVTRLDPGGGNVYRGLRFRGLSDVLPAGNLSDGQLSWVAFVALAALGGGRSLLAFDGPENLLHPALLGPVMSLLVDVGDSCQVVLATHSDRVLELLEEPAKAVRVQPRRRPRIGRLARPGQARGLAEGLRRSLRVALQGALAACARGRRRGRGLVSGAKPPCV